MVLFGLTEAIMGKLHVVKVCKSGCTLNLNLFSSKQVLNLPLSRCTTHVHTTVKLIPYFDEHVSWLPVAVGLVSFSGIHNSRGC